MANRSKLILFSAPKRRFVQNSSLFERILNENGPWTKWSLLLWICSSLSPPFINEHSPPNSPLRWVLLRVCLQIKRPGKACDQKLITTCSICCRNYDWWLKLNKFSSAASRMRRGTSLAPCAQQMTWDEYGWAAGEYEKWGLIDEWRESPVKMRGAAESEISCGDR